MAKERMLTVVVPIKDSDAVEVSTLPAPDADNVNVIYKYNGAYYRLWLNPESGSYEYRVVVDREFPELGKPLEIFEFTYDAIRMGVAPTISASNVEWFADKDANGKDITLEDKWSIQECHVIFNNENFYLKQIPTSSKSHEDERYKYDLDFVSERVVLEHVYVYDVVQPFVSEKPVSESSVFSFYGDIAEFIKRINASLLKSGLSKLSRKYVPFPKLSTSDTYEMDVPLLTYERWNNVGVDAESMIGHEFIDTEMMLHFLLVYRNTGGDYNRYLMEYIYENENGVFTLNGYQVVLGTDKKGDTVSSEDKLVTLEDKYIYDALQLVKDVYEMQYYVHKRENGDTLIVIGDCEHDFADMDGQDEIVRDEDGIPISSSPVDYGVDNELLSKEKANTTEDIVTRITGVGSEENIPWYYPNPTADGWIKPLYNRNGDIISVDLSYPIDEGDTIEENTRYEKYLKNRIGDVFTYGKKIIGLTKDANDDTSSLSGLSAQLKYSMTLKETSFVHFKNAICTFESVEQMTLTVTKDGELYTNPMFSEEEAEGNLPAGHYEFTIDLVFNQSPVITSDVLYYYPSVVALYKPSASFTWATIFAIIKALTGNPHDIIELIAWGDTRGMKLPAFVSTNPNLVFKNENKDLFDSGWYSGDRKITGYSYTNTEARLLSNNTSYYVFAGGNGTKSIDTDDVYEVRVDDNSEWYGHPSLQFGNVDHGDYFRNAILTGLIDSVLQGENMYGIYGVGAGVPSYIRQVDYDVNNFIDLYFDFSVEVYSLGWYKKGNEVDLADYGLSVNYGTGESPNVGDTINFQRAKYITPQPNLMPEIYIKTDGERRFYNSINYPRTGGTADKASGETLDQNNKIVNDIYQNGDIGHYVFESEYKNSLPHEYIENFDDIKPSIKEQVNYVHVPILDLPSDWSSVYQDYYIKTVDGSFVPADETFDPSNDYYLALRIDVVEEFGYDEYDSDEIWESEEDENSSGEYKHPYFFAKLRPLGFNIFDLALQDDMVISMTTGHCGACNFRIAVDENTKKNPVQIWEHDVYRKTGEGTYSQEPVYIKGSLRRHISVDGLYYKIDGNYIPVNRRTENSVGFTPDIRTPYINRGITYADFDTHEIISGMVGSAKKKSRVVFEGDVVTRGRFIDSQQDTSVKYVWVALEKDTESYGVIMPSAKPNYGDHAFDVYIRPNAISDVHTSSSTRQEDEDNADKFVLTNIRMPQVYLRRAEKELSKKLVSKMYEMNYQKFNFSINFSRIFLAENEEFDNLLNENSVLYIDFNRRTYRQYVKHYAYKMSEKECLPEITVDLNEELSVTRTSAQQQAVQQQRLTTGAINRYRREVDRAIVSIERNYVDKTGNSIIGGNIVSRNAVASMNDLKTLGDNSATVGLENKSDIYRNSMDFSSAMSSINIFNTGVSNRLKQIRSTVEKRLLPVAKDVEENSGCSGVSKYHFHPNASILGVDAKLWLDASGDEQTFSSSVCPTDQGMVDITWTNIDFS